MTHKPWFVLLAFGVILGIAFPRHAGAHRLDEYLQATRFSVEVDRIVAEINLTPGADVAENVITTIDRDGNGEVTASEAAAYSEYVVRSLSLAVDGQPRSFALDVYRLPSLAAMRRGEGIIRLRASTNIRASVGPHRLAYSNTHRSDIGVYLVNALIPSDERIHITGQSRDMLQREFTLDYAVSGSEADLDLAAVWPPLAGLALAAAFHTLARRLN